MRKRKRKSKSEVQKMSSKYKGMMWMRWRERDLRCYNSKDLACYIVTIPRDVTDPARELNPLATSFGG
jgi:hypothetical protein